MLRIRSADSIDPPRKRIDTCRVNGQSTFQFGQISEGSPLTPRRSHYKWVNGYCFMKRFLNSISPEDITPEEVLPQAARIAHWVYTHLLGRPVLLVQFFLIIPLLRTHMVGVPNFMFLQFLIHVLIAGMSSPVGQRAQSHHVHRNSSHVGANTHVTVTPPPSTPTHHRANSSGGSTTTSGSSLLSTLTSPESDTASLVTGNSIFAKDKVSSTLRKRKFWIGSPEEQNVFEIEHLY